MLLNEFTLHHPNTIKEAVKLNSELKASRILAGGTFLLNTLKVIKKKGLKAPANIISLKNISPLKGISFSKDTLTIGAMTSINDLIDSKDISDYFPIIKTVSENIATTPIRNMATIGGNIACRYTWTEFPAVLIVLDAKLHFMSQDGKEIIISSEDFFNNNAKTNGILTQISIKAEKDISAAYYRVKKSTSVDVPILAACIKTKFNKKKFQSTRICINTGVTFPKRIIELEEFLDKSSLNKDTADEALKYVDIDALDKNRDEYKGHMYRVAIKSLIDKIANNKE